MKKLTKVLLATSLVFVMAASIGCSKKEEAQPAQSEQKEESDKLIMATNAEFPPYEYRESQTIVGIDVDIAQAIAESMGKELQIEDMSFDSIIPALASGKADVGIAGMTVTEERLVNVDFSNSYVTASQAIIVRIDEEGIVGPDDLAGKTIGVQLGTTGDIYAGDIEGATVERYNKGMEAVQSLVQSKVDAVIIDDQVAKSFAEDKKDEIKVLDEPFTLEEYAIAVNKGNTELLEQINAALKDLKESGKLQEIIDKYIAAE